MLPSCKELGSLPCSFVFRKRLRRIDINSSLNVWRDSPVKPSGARTFYTGKFLITVLIPWLTIGLFRFSISTGFSLGRLYVPRNSSISIHPVCHPIIVHKSVWSLCFSVISCNVMSHLLFLIYLSLLFFS